MNSPPLPTTAPATSVSGMKRVAEYYDRTQVLYTHVWDRSGVHYGLWDETTRRRDQAIRNLDRHVGEALAIPPGGRVLDAGCGIGGTSVFLAREFGHDVEGITLSAYQLAKARARAALSELEPRPHFAIGDYLKTGYPDESFDGVIAIESACYAESKRSFLAEANRVLRPGGRLVVSDGFRSGEVGPRDEADYHRMMRGMALTDLARADAFEDDLRAVGFVDVGCSDKRGQIMPSAHAIRRLSWVGLAVCALPCAIGLFPRGWFVHGLAGIAQRPLFERGTVVYCVFTAVKPHPRSA